MKSSAQPTQQFPGRSCCASESTRKSTKDGTSTIASRPGVDGVNVSLAASTIQNNLASDPKTKDSQITVEADHGKVISALIFALAEPLTLPP